MKIGLLHNSVLPPKTYGGIERIVMALAREFTERGHQVVLFCREGSQTQKDYETIFLKPEYDGEELDLPSNLDFLHSHQPLHHVPKVPYLITIHGNGHPGEEYLPNTNFLSQSHARNHNAKYFIYNGVDPTRYTYVENKEDYFVFLAKTTWRVKNLRTAVAWAQDLGVRLEVMGGDGWSREGIHYNGKIDEATKVQLLGKAKALIYPTNWDEPCAAAPLEALACGTPVIASANGCMPELVRQGTGVVCRTYTELLDSVSKLKSVKPSACRHSVEEFFSLKRMAQDYLSLFERIREKGPLDHQPRYNFSKGSVQLLYKPTLWNRARVELTGKI